MWVTEGWSYQEKHFFEGGAWLNTLHDFEEFLKNICTGLFPMDMEVFIADLELMLGKKEDAEID